MGTITTFDLDRFIRAAEERDAPSAERPCELIVLSAKSSAGLQNVADQWIGLLGQDSATSLSDLAFTAATVPTARRSPDTESQNEYFAHGGRGERRLRAELSAECAAPLWLTAERRMRRGKSTRRMIRLASCREP